jgi:protein-tyrosine-phosphatase
MNILFVCTANINRSFMAERILQGQLKKHAKYNIDVSSAALIDMKAAAADPVAAELLIANGYDGSGHKSSLLTESKIAEADLILVMEGSQERLILDQFPKAEGKIHLLNSYSQDYSESNRDIKDPYRMSSYHYRLCFSEIYLAIQGLLKCI